MGLLNVKQHRDYLKLGIYPPCDRSVPYKREWRRGAESCFLGGKASENPWEADWQRRNYAVLSGAWQAGWNAAKLAMQ